MKRLHPAFMSLFKFGSVDIQETAIPLTSDSESPLKIGQLYDSNKTKPQTSSYAHEDLLLSI